MASQPTPLLVCHAGSLYFLLCTFSYIYSILLGLFIWLENPNKGLCVRLKARSVLEVWIDAFDLSLTPLLGCRLTILYVFPPVYDLLTNYGTLTIPSLIVTSPQVLG